MGSQGLMFSWLKPCSHELGKRGHIANLGWRKGLCSDTQLLCHSRGKLGNTLWFHCELILTSVTELFHSLLLNAFEISSQKSFLWTFLLLSFVFQSQDAALPSRPHHAGCSSFSLQQHTVYKIFLRSFCYLWFSQRMSLEEVIQARRVEEKGR